MSGYSAGYQLVSLPTYSISHVRRSCLGINTAQKLDLPMFASVANMMQIHLYIYSKHGKCHICPCGVANVAFAMFTTLANMSKSNFPCSEKFRITWSYVKS